MLGHWVAEGTQEKRNALPLKNISGWWDGFALYPDILGVL